MIPPFQLRASRLARWTMLGAAVILGPWAEAETHTFTNYDGKPLAAEIVAVKNGEVVVKRSDGKAFSLDLHDLPAADKAYVKAWQTGASQPRDASATADSDIEISIDATPVAGAITPKVTLVNRETALNFKGLKGTLMLVEQAKGRPDKFRVVAVESFTGDVAANGKTDFVAAARPTNETPAMPGQDEWVYSGYVFVLQNAGGDIIQFRHSDSYHKTGAESLQLSTGTVFLVRNRASPPRARATSSRKPLENVAPTRSVLPLHLRR